MGDAAARCGSDGSRDRARPVLRHTTIGTSRVGDVHRAPRARHHAARLVARRPRARGFHEMRDAAPRARRGRSRARRRGARFPCVDLALADDAFLEIALAEHESATSFTPTHRCGRRSDFRPDRAGHPRLRPDRHSPATPRSAARRDSGVPGDGNPRCLRRAGRLDVRARRECDRRRALFGDSLPAMVGWPRRMLARGDGRRGRVDRRTDRRDAFVKLDAWLDVPTRKHSIGVTRCRSDRPAAAARPLVHDADHDLLQRGDRRAGRGSGATRSDGATIRRLARGAESCWRTAATDDEDYLPRFARDGTPAAQRRSTTTWSPGPRRRSATCRFPHTPASAPSLYYLNYRSPAPFDPPDVRLRRPADRRGLPGDELTRGFA